MPNETPLIYAAFVVGAVAVLILIVWLSTRKRRGDRVGDYAPLPAQEELATIEGKTELTSGGTLAVIVMAICNVIGFFSFVSASTVLQQQVALLGCISSSVFWGVCALAGRKYTYRVFRDAPSAFRKEPRA